MGRFFRKNEKKISVTLLRVKLFLKLYGYYTKLMVNYACKLDCSSSLFLFTVEK